MNERTSDTDIFNILKRMQEKETGEAYNVLQKQLSDIAMSIAVHTERDRASEREFQELKERLIALERKVSTVADMATKWRGAFIMLMALGGAAGTIAAFWDRFSKWVHP
jgi:hypothetical protein